MKRLTWLHLSDWHQKGPDFDRGVVRDALIKDMHERERIDPSLAQVDFVVFSGDLAFSGQAIEYEAARQHLLDPALSAVGLNPSRLFIVPGNHDLNRETVYEMLPPELQRPLNSDTLVQKWLLDAKKRKRALEPFEEYRKFVSEYSGQATPDYGSIVFFDVNGKRVALLGLNSAWMNARHKEADGTFNDYGFTLVGEPQFHDALAQIADTELRIAVVHHPFDWLAGFDRNRTEARLRRECHFILRGHVHDPEVHVMRGTAGDCVIIPAGASYNRRVAEDPRYTNAYNWVHLDFEAREGVVYLRRWSDQRNEWIADSDSHTEGRFVLDDLPKELGKKRATADAPPTAPLKGAPPSHFDRERMVLEGYLNALVRNNTDLDSGGIKQTKVQVVVPLDEIYVGLQADRDRPDVDRRVMQEELDEIKKRLEREEDPKERERQYQIWASQARTLQRALEISGPREDLADIVQRHRQVVILGDPGSGKTTLMRYLTLRLARAILEEPERLFRPQELWDERNVWRVPDFGPVRLPILLRISHYAEARQKDPDLALADYLPRYFAGISVPHADELGPLFQQLLDEGRCMILLDGLDEIIDPTDRRNIASAIGQFAGVYRETGLPDWLTRSLAFVPARAKEDSEAQVKSEDEQAASIITHWGKDVPEDVRQEWMKRIEKQLKAWRRPGRAIRLAWELLDEARYAHVGNRFVVTSRIAGYHFAGVPGEFEHFSIRRMNLSDIKLFLEKWCPAVERRIAVAPGAAQVEQRARREIEGILQAVETTSGVRRMAENPLLLRILAIIHRNEAHLPQRRVELYETASVTLLRDWHLERGTKGAAIDDVKATSLLGPLAFYIHEHRASGFLSKGETERILAAILARERGEADPEQPSLETREAVLDFLKKVREHSGLFVERGEGLYGFMHLTFEEYFTARHLVSSSVRACAQILERLHQPRWREPILLAVGSLSKQFYEDIPDLLRAILNAGSLYEGMLHRDLLFAAACVGDSVNVAPVLRQEIARRLLTIYCDRRGAGRFRLLQQQVKDALLTLCNDQGDAAVEAALAETLGSCADPVALTCALDAVDWLKARTPAVASALAACLDLSELTRAQDLLRRVRERQSANDNGRQPEPIGWDAVRDDVFLARLLGAMLGSRLSDSLLSSMGIPEEAFANANRELRPFSVYRTVKVAKSLLQRFTDASANQRNVELWRAVAKGLQMLLGLAYGEGEFEAATEQLIRAVAGSLENWEETRDTAQELNALVTRWAIFGRSEEPANDMLTLDQALAQFRDLLCKQERAIAKVDFNQVFQSAGSQLLRATSSGNTLAATFMAAAKRFGPLEDRPDEDALLSDLQNLQSEIGRALLALLRSPANGQQYQEAALFLAFPSINLTLRFEGEEVRLSAEATAIICADLDGADITRRRWALQALTSRAVCARVEFTDARRALLLGLLDAPADQARSALAILFILGLTPDLLASCYRVLSLPDHPLAHVVVEQLDAVKEVKGDRQILALLDEGLRDATLRLSAIELLHKVKWQNADTFSQALTWLSGKDTEVRHLAGLLLAGQDDVLAIPRSVVARATQERLLATGPYSWSALRQDTRLVRLLDGLWSHGWNDALTQLWVAEPAESYLGKYLPHRHWNEFDTHSERDESLRWLLKKARLGHRLIPMFQDASSRLLELEGEATRDTPREEHLSAIEHEVMRQIDVLVTLPVTSPLLRAEASLLSAAILKTTIPSIPAETLAAALDSADDNDWFSALSRLARQENKSPLIISVLTQTFETTNRERRLRALVFLYDHTTYREAMAETLITHVLNQGTDTDEALLGLDLLLRLKRPPAELYTWLRSLCLADSQHPLSAYIRKTLAENELAPDSPSAALAHLLAADIADASTAAALPLLATDMLDLLVEVLIEIAQSPNDRVRVRGEQRLYRVCSRLPSDGSTSAVETLLRFWQDAEACKNGHLANLSIGAIHSIKHTQRFWVSRWLEAMGGEGQAYNLAYRGLSEVYQISTEVLPILCAAVNDVTLPLAARCAIAGALNSIQRGDSGLRADATIHATLTSALNDPDTGLRRTAALALQWTSGQGAWMVGQALLLAAKGDSDAYTRIWALRSLGHVLHAVRGFRDVDISKEALFSWLKAQTKGDYRFRHDDVVGHIDKLRNIADEGTLDTDAVLAALAQPDVLGLQTESSTRLRDSADWIELVQRARREWEVRRYWLETLPLLPDAISHVQGLLEAPEPATRRAAACALARLYQGDDDRPDRLHNWMPDNTTLLRALLDATIDTYAWNDDGESNVSHHPWVVKQIVGWMEARPPEERNQLIGTLMDDLDKALKGHDESYPNWWPARRILVAVLAELSERLTYSAFTHTHDLADVVTLFAHAAADSESSDTRRFAIRTLGNLQQLTDQVADVFFAACQDLGSVYRETRTAVTKFKTFASGSLVRLTAAIRSPSVTVAYHAALLLGELGVSRSEDLGREGRGRVADELVQLLDEPLAKRIVYDFRKSTDGMRVGPLYDEIYEALVRVVAGPDAPRSETALGQQSKGLDIESFLQ